MHTHLLALGQKLDESLIFNAQDSRPCQWFGWKSRRLLHQDPGRRIFWKQPKANLDKFEKLLKRPGQISGRKLFFQDTCSDFTPDPANHGNFFAKPRYWRPDNNFWKISGRLGAIRTGKGGFSRSSPYQLPYHWQESFHVTMPFKIDMLLVACKFAQITVLIYESRCYLKWQWNINLLSITNQNISLPDFPGSSVWFQGKPVIGPYTLPAINC